MNQYICPVCNKTFLECDLRETKCSENCCESYISKYCPKCSKRGRLVKVRHKTVPTTKGYRIRNMTDEELAKESMFIIADCDSDEFFYHNVFTRKTYDNKEEAIKDTIKWLQSEAD